VAVSNFLAEVLLSQHFLSSLLLFMNSEKSTLPTVRLNDIGEENLAESTPGGKLYSIQICTLITPVSEIVTNNNTTNNITGSTMV